MHSNQANRKGVAELMRECLSYAGRIDRRQYLLYIVLIGLIWGVCAFLLNAFVLTWFCSSAVSRLLLGTVSVFLYLPQQVKRCQDIGYRGLLPLTVWFILGILLEIVAVCFGEDSVPAWVSQSLKVHRGLSFILTLALLLVPGQKRANQFGEVP